MAKYRITAKGSLVTIKGKLTKADIVNAREIEYLMHNYIKGLFKISYDGKRTIEYTAPMAIPLDRYLKNSMIDEESFWRIVAQIVNITRAVETNGLYQNNLWLDSNAIFINEHTKDLYFIYQPFMSVNNPGNAFALIHDITYVELKKLAGVQNQYLLEFQNFLNQGNHYRMDFIRDYVERVYPEIRFIVHSDGRGTINVPPVNRPSVNRDLEDESLIDDTVCLREDDTVLLGTAQYEADDDEYEATTVLTQEVQKQIRMIHQKDAEHIKVAGTIFHIGKSKLNDYCIKGNTAISRKHAVITRNDGDYYLEDSKSTNGTFVNGKRLEAEERVLLQDGDEVTFADEVFVIQIE